MAHGAGIARVACRSTYWHRSRAAAKHRIINQAASIMVAKPKAWHQ